MAPGTRAPGGARTHAVRQASAQASANSTLTVVLVVAVGCGVVAVAANGLQLLAPALDLGDRVLLARVCGAIAALSGLGWLVREARAVGGPRGQGAGAAAVSLRTAATIMGMLALLALLNPPEAGPVDRPSGGGFGALGANPFGDDVSSGDVLPAETRGGDPLVRGQDPPEIIAGPIPDMPDMSAGPLERALRSSRWLILLAFLVIVMKALTRRQRHHEPEVEFTVPLSPAEAKLGLLASLDEVAAGEDDAPGRITRAYRTLLHALSEAGAPREPWEAPHEHLNRVLGPLGVPSEELHTLAALYVLAHFSGRAISDDHRSQAVAALEASLEHLRDVEPLPTPSSDEWAGAWS